METLLHDPDMVRGEAARRDRERLQGVWDFFSGHREAQLLIQGEHFTVRFKNGPIYMGTFTLDPTRKPKTIDMVITDGPGAFRWVSGRSWSTIPPDSTSASSGPTSATPRSRRSI